MYLGPPSQGHAVHGVSQALKKRDFMAVHTQTWRSSILAERNNEVPGYRHGSMLLSVRMIWSSQLVG
jgi:hypothetical protein